MMFNLKIDTSYKNYDAIDYYSYEYILKSPIEELLDKLLINLDATKIYKDKLALPINSWKYEDTINRFIRILFRIPLYNYIIYNKYVNLLIERHNENINFQENYIEPNKNINNKKQKSNKNKVKNIYIKTETHNIFTGELMYDYTNFATGDSFVSTNPNLLEELNAPKRNKKIKKEPRKDFGKIILNFKLK